jgi:hypothetical protein
MLGVQFIVDEHGKKTAAVIDLKINAELWDDFYDRALARSRQGEPRETLESVRKRLNRRKPRCQPGRQGRPDAWAQTRQAGKKDGEGSQRDER